MIDQTIGKGWRSTVTTHSSGRCNRWARYDPTSVPMKPTAIETRQPPCDPPAIARPMPPQTPAMASKMRRPVRVRLKRAEYATAVRPRPRDEGSRDCHCVAAERGSVLEKIDEIGSGDGRVARCDRGCVALLVEHAAAARLIRSTAAPGAPRASTRAPTGATPPRACRTASSA
jgi:hypothetical protein